MIEAQDVTFLLVDLIGFINPSTASVPSADIHRKSQLGSIIEASTLYLTNLESDTLIFAAIDPLNYK